MNNNISRLELLPNETFIEIFQYFDSKELFQAFDNLNIRFNRLIRSFGYLIFKLYDPNDIYQYDFIPYIDSLVIHCQTSFDPQVFTNIRHLSIIRLTAYSAVLIQNKYLPYLEDLTVKKLLDGQHTFLLYDAVFSITFPRLKSCYLFQDRILTIDTKFSNLPMLCYLQIGIIDLQVYGIILSVCPNLNFFKFRLNSNRTSFNGKPHGNLKRMIIKAEDYIQSKNDYTINLCLSVVPNLERLYIHQDFFQGNIPHYLKSDWYASTIARYLPLLTRFVCNLKACYLTTLDLQVMNTVHEMKGNFHNAHSNRYQSQFHFKLIY
jgi:hypothetical protein